MQTEDRYVFPFPMPLVLYVAKCFRYLFWLLCVIFQKPPELKYLGSRQVLKASRFVTCWNRNANGSKRFEWISEIQFAAASSRMSSSPTLKFQRVHGELKMNDVVQTVPAEFNHCLATKDAPSISVLNVVVNYQRTYCGRNHQSLDNRRDDERNALTYEIDCRQLRRVLDDVRGWRFGKRMATTSDTRLGWR